ncbi:2-oxoglutarate-dependent dioxygenase AOP2 [Eucalyptus grandis]|uniref:2-oxoglutarate-dependent dioxygenase AOP2 n=1 Tax=Eucalyptus grandis TaxID=71139 RepID=UPI0005275180|nr:2-oxoglutarate-dependent dioxygenase AOP2 [Eucalyptus grandis]XP_018725574.2 2-oxoglutarate-dependent dioxygenase AOP2 [Eucalyptus grandis]
MDSISTLKLPLIDLSELDGSKPGTVQWDSLQSQVREALEEFGCFEALTDRMTLELHNDVFQEMEALLELPTDVKRRFSDPNKPYDGYRGNLPHSPLYEAFGINYAPNSGSIEGFANLIWPEGNTRFCETMKTYVTRVLELDSLVKKLVLGSLGVDKYLESLAKSVGYNLRLIRYAAPGTKESKKLGAWCHRDANFVTILHHNHVKGLEVQTKDGCWFEVASSSATSFIVFAGESFYGWSNGRLYSPCHRVMMSGHEARYCIGFFSNGQGTMQCPDELVDDQHPLLFKPFDVAGLFRIYKTKEGESGASAMDTYYRI